jgi:hypothetical protein
VTINSTQAPGILNNIGNKIKHSKVMENARNVSPLAIIGAGVVIGTGYLLTQKAANLNSKVNFTPLQPVKVEPSNTNNGQNLSIFV